MRGWRVGYMEAESKNMTWRQWPLQHRLLLGFAISQAQPVPHPMSVCAAAKGALKGLRAANDRGDGGRIRLYTLKRETSGDGSVAELV